MLYWDKGVSSWVGQVGFGESGFSPSPQRRCGRARSRTALLRVALLAKTERARFKRLLNLGLGGAGVSLSFKSAARTPQLPPSFVCDSSRSRSYALRGTRQSGWSPAHRPGTAEPLCSLRVVGVGCGGGTRTHAHDAHRRSGPLGFCKASAIPEPADLPLRYSAAPESEYELN